ncbi:hypothetical protein F4805DRAFT_250115 [Annulohypoxylon moriforme]|nr:hypothetical protein F4805DRAFT_250115 [Annulohypoxylon moriforme]
MSGFEIAGVVLGAFPIALEALKAYREVSRAFYLFHEIRPEYTKCEQNLKFYHVAFKSHLRRILRPLIEDESKMNDLLSNPEGSFWGERDIMVSLKQRLGEEVYQLLVDCIEGIKDVMEKLNHELVPNSALKPYLKKPKSPKFEARLKDSVRPQLYKLRFSVGEATRNRHFEELKRYDFQLTRLLSMIDDETQFLQARAPAINSLPCSSALCSIWVHANALFRAITSAWICSCPDQHLAELLLQHRTTNKNDFNMLFAKQSVSSWHIQRALITAGDDPHFQKQSIGGTVDINTTVHQPNHRKSIPIRSALKGGNDINNKLAPIQPKSKITCTSVSINSQPGQGMPISSLCKSLNPDTSGCYGYLTEEDYRYYICRLSHQQVERFNSVTLDQILRKEVLPPPSRRQRYALSLTLASSFLQLLDTPWLPYPLKKSDIAFINDEKDSNVFLLDHPYLKREFTVSSTPNRGSQKQQPSGTSDTTNHNENTERCESLELIGIVLLELCFGQLLEEHPLRKQWPAGDDELERYKFDVFAARQWNNEVNEEAGPDFDEAIKWCFEGYRDAPQENWRQEMLQHVVRPLENCHMYLCR